MNNFYIYRFVYKNENESGEKHDTSATVIFCPGEDINNTNLQTEIRLFYEKHHHTDEIYAIGGQNIQKELIENFIVRKNETFKYLHKVDKDYLESNLFVFSFNIDGILQSLNDKFISDIFEKEILNEGLQQIFVTRGGFVESKGAHHFVFPSGKHCNKFLRTGNILLHSSEIYFIGYSLLQYYDVEKHNQIYCDTSSINTIAFALIDLKRRLIANTTYRSIPIESFSSYTGLQSSKKIHYPKALILISASTSANILNKIKKNNRLAKKENMIILYYLGSNDAYIENENNILCNLTKSDYNLTGIEFYNTYEANDCIHCQSGSYPVNVIGDVFLLEKPKINPITLTVKDVPKDLSRFVKEFKSVKFTNNNVFKVSYKENEKEINNKYEVYFDFLEVIKDIDNTKYKEFSTKLDNYINQYVPSNTKFLIHLNDAGSKILAERILDKIKNNYKENCFPKIISQDEISTINSEEIGSVVIVASCISNGKNLLYLSRSLRPIDGLRIIYFIGLTRTKNEQHLNFLKSNLKLGRYGIETYTFVSVYNFYMINQSIDTTWLKEVDFLRDLKIFNEKYYNNTEYINDFLNSRILYIEDGMSDEYRGLSNNIFFPEIIKNEELKLRKNFAFLSFNDLSQADVYFTMSSIINHLRNSEDLNRCLRQTEYVRNIIEPGNFNRFNDGVIQASILRIAEKDELAYGLDYDLSKKMVDILSTMIKNYNTDQGEGLFEFVFALATQKMTIYKIHLIEICNLLKENIDNDFYLFFVKYIELKIIATTIN
ncbi:MAG: hypothetical protein V4670_03460 [Bacteroidota bacterium]